MGCNKPLHNIKDGVKRQHTNEGLIHNPQTKIINTRLHYYTIKQKFKCVF